MPHMKLRAASLLLALFAAAGCRSSDSSQNVVARDSAGIRIMEYPPNFKSDQWQLIEPPVVRIGVLEGDPRYEFVNVIAAVRLEDGSIAVLDRSTKQISIFAPTGEFIRAIGGEGEGPGEYRQPVALWRVSSDTLAVFDPTLSRVSLTTAHGTWIGSNVVRAISTPVPRGSFGTGALLVLDINPDLQSYGMADYWKVSIEGLDSIGRFPNLENIAERDVQRITSQDNPLIPRYRRVGAGGHSIFTSPNNQYKVEVRDTTAMIRAILRWQGRDLAVSAEGVARVKDVILDRVAESRRQDHRRTLDQQFVDDTYPAFGDLLVDHEGRAWLQMYRQPFDSGDDAWIVVSAEPKIIAEVNMPAGVQPLEIGDGYVLARVRDEMGVQYVVLYELDQDQGEPGQ